MSFPRPIDGVRRGLRSVAAMSRVDLALRLTLLDLLLRPVGDWTIRPFVLALAGTGLLFPGVLRKPALWWLLALLTGARDSTIASMKLKHIDLISGSVF